MRKGQGALEYLMTYGWALLIIVIVGAALYSLGVLNPATYQQKGCRGFQYFTYQDQKLTTSAYSIEMLNGNRDIVVNYVTFDGSSTGIGSNSISAGKKTTLNGTSDVTTKSAGDTFSSTVVVGYNVTGGITDQTDTASCVGKVE